jgi:tetratricopeptide (TPR) repeat protein
MPVVPTESDGEHFSVNLANPWLGSLPYKEKDQEYFFGRSTEAEQLFERVRYEPLTVLFGPSGMGKTSLLQAGLFPLLRKGDYLPVLIRLDFSEPGEELANLNLRKQVRSALAEELKKSRDRALADFCTEADELWEVFHDVERGFLKTDALRVVLVFDQFEEIFTKGEDGEHQRHRKTVDRAIGAFISEIAGLVENEPSRELSERIDEDDDLRPRFDRYKQPFRMILAMRHDFLSRLERYRREMPSIMKNRYELRALEGGKAFEAVFLPAKRLNAEYQLLDETVAEAIVCHAAKVPEKTPMSEIRAVSSALLSIMCWGLNKRRIGAGVNSITADSVTNSSMDILEEFYRLGFEGLQPAVQHWVERRLLSRSGHRDSVLKETAIDDLRDAGIKEPEDALRKLIDWRVLGEDYHGGHPRIELSHDLLTDAARASREREEVRINRERQTKELDEMIERMKQEWRSPTATARPLIEDYYRKLTETDQFDIFGERSAIALTLAANNLLYVHGYIKEGLSAAEKALKILQPAESDTTEIPQAPSRTAAAALFAYAKGLLETGRFTESEASFTRVLTLEVPDTLPTLLWDDPFFVRILALIGIGDGLEKQGCGNRAIQLYDQALEYIDFQKNFSKKNGAEDDQIKDLGSRINLYKTITLLAKAFCIGKGDGALEECYEEIESLLDGLAAGDANTSDAYREYLAAKLRWQKGLLSFESENLGESIRQFESAFRSCERLLKQDPENWIWSSLQVQIYWYLGKYYIGFAGRSVRQFYLKMQEFSEAEKEQAAAGKLSANMQALADTIERGYAKAKHYFSDMKDLATELEKAQPGFFPRYLLAAAQWHLREFESTQNENSENWEEVLTAFRKSVENTPNFAKGERSIVLTLGNIGLSLLKVRPEKAISWFGIPAGVRQTVPFQEVESWIQSLRGDALKKLSRFDEAIGSLRLAAELAKDISESEPIRSRYVMVSNAREKLAQYYVDIDDTQNADFFYESAAQACDHEQSCAELMDRKGSIYLGASEKWSKRGDLVRWYDAIEKAETVLQKAFRLDPINYELCKRLQEVHEKSIGLKEALGAEGASEIGAEKVDEIRNRIIKIIERTENLLYPRDHEPQTWTVRPLIAGPWIALTARERVEELNRLNDSQQLKEKSFLEKIRFIRKLRLPCYEDVDLFEAEGLFQDSRPSIWAYLRATEGIVILDGTSPPIHAFNQEHRLRLESPVEAATYFRFFCGALAGGTQESTFRIIDSEADLSWLPSATTEPQNFQRIIYPFRLKQDLNGDWSARCTMVHDTRAYYVLMKLPRTGFVQMDIDNVIPSALPVLAEYFRGFRFFAPLRSDEPAQANAPEDRSGQGQATDPQIKSVSEAQE